MPLVTIILPVYNGAATLAVALRSLFSQTMTDFEIVLLDDGSTDNSLQIAKGFVDSRLVIISDGMNKGLAYRLNQGIDLARGQYLARMDQDDICFPDRLMKQLDYLDLHSEIDLLGCRTVAFRDGAEIIGILPYRDSHEELCQQPWLGFYLTHPSWMGRATWFRQHRYRMPEVMLGEDQELLLRAYPESTFATHSDVLLAYRKKTFSLKRTLRARRSLISVQLSHFLSRHQWINVILAITFLIIKSLIDIVTSTTWGRVAYHKIMTQAAPLGLVEELRKLRSSVGDVEINGAEEDVSKPFAHGVFAFMKCFHKKRQEDGVVNGGSHSVSFLLWTVLFSYSTCAALIFQKLLLPLFPALQGSSGLLSADSTYFHSVAVALAESIKIHGWSSWTVYPAPGASGNVAVLGALYAIFNHDPALIIPLNAAIHATTGICLFFIAQKLWDKEVGTYTGIIVAILFVIFPSSLNWYGQVHKDGYAIFGAVLVLYAVVLVLSSPYSRKNLVSSTACAVLGVATVAFVRPYNLKLLFLALLVICFFHALSVLFLKNMRQQWRVCFSLSIIAVVVLAGVFLMDYRKDPGHEAGKAYTSLALSKEVWDFHGNGQSYSGAFLPDKLKGYLKSVAEVRVANIYYTVSTQAKSGIDLTVMPDRPDAVFAYLPRAVQIALFAPFPSMWFDTFSVTRLVAVAEMALWYMVAPGIFLSLYYKRSLAIAGAMLFSLCFLAVYGLVLPNVGTLYRIRYLYLFVFIMIGISGYVSWIMKHTSLLPKYNQGLSLARESKVIDHDIPLAVSGYSRGGITSAGFMVTLFTGISFFGFFIRDVLLARWFGLSCELDAFFIAVVMPMFFVAIFSTPMGTAIIPFFLEMREKMTHFSVARYVRKVTSMITVFLGVLCFSMLLLSPYFLPYLGLNFTPEKIHYATELLLWTLPLLFLSGMLIVGNSILNALGKYTYPAVAQCIVPIIAIATLFILGRELGVLSVAIGMVIGQICNYLLIEHTLRQNKYSVFPVFHHDHEVSVLPLCRQYVPLVLAAFFAGIALPVNNAMASSLSAGSVAALNLGNKFILFITGLIGSGIATVILPYFSSFVAQSRLREIRHELSFFLFFSTIISIFFSLILYLTTDLFVENIFGGSVFSHDDISIVGSVIKYGIIQIPFFTCSLVILKYLTAFRSNRIIMIVAVFGLFLNVLGNLVLMPYLGVAGISLAISLSLMLTTLLLVLIMCRLKHVQGIDFIFLVLIWLLFLTGMFCLHYDSYVGVAVSFVALLCLCAGHLKTIFSSIK